MEATLGAAMQTADVRAAQDAQSYRRRPVVNTELTAEERQLLQVRKCLIDGFYKAKACVSVRKRRSTHWATNSRESSSSACPPP